MTTYFKQGLDVTGNVNLTGNITVGGDQNFGDANTDSITFTSDITSNMLPDVSLTYNLGSTTKQWNNLYVNDVIADNNISVGGTITSTNTSEHNLGKVVINDDQISVSTGNELKLSSPANLILEPTDNIWISASTKLIFEGTAPDDYEIKLQATAVTADREIILPDAEGTLALQSYVDQAETDAVTTSNSYTDTATALLDGASAGTVVNNKAVIYDASGGIVLGDWRVIESGVDLLFQTGGVTKMKLDPSGNLTVTGDVTAFGSI
tara:strand:+ start:265 stop:1059 length:795 start_codon:yes stop_codon:yes gene_type:complete